MSYSLTRVRVLCAVLVFVFLFGGYVRVSAYVFTQTLDIGSRGQEVTMVQKVLNALGFYTYPEFTDYYGVITRAAVREFQRAEGISPIGVVGPLTRAALYRASESVGIGVENTSGSAQPPATVSSSQTISTGLLVRTTDTVKVRGTPSLSGLVRGIKVSGAFGPVISGPVVVDGRKWWQVDFSGTVDGWVAGEYIVPRVSGVGAVSSVVPTHTVPLTQSSSTTTISTILSTTTNSSVPVGSSTTTPTTTVVVVPTGIDVVPPTVPLRFVGHAVDSSSIEVDWDASTDAVGVAGYNVYRNTVKIARVPGSTTVFTDLGLRSDTLYSYAVDAYDAAGNTSAKSRPIGYRTMLDTVVVPPESDTDAVVTVDDTVVTPPAPTTAPTTTQTVIVSLPANANEVSIQNAINSLVGNGKVVLPNNKVITITSGIVADVRTRSIEIDLNGSVLKMGANVAVVSANGANGPIVKGITLSKNSSGNMVATFPTTTTGLVVGDWVKIFSDDALPGGHPDGGNPPRMGQAMQVLSVVGAHVTMRGSMLKDNLYTTNVRASKYISGSFTLRNGTILGDLKQQSYKSSLVSIKSVVSPVVDRIALANNNSFGVNLVDTINAQVANTSVKHLVDDPRNGYYGYGVHSFASRNTAVSNVYCERVRHCTDNNTNGLPAGYAFPYRYGPDINFTVTDSFTFNNTAAAFDWHSECNTCSMRDLISVDSFTALGIRGMNNTATNVYGVGNERGIEFLEWGVADSRYNILTNIQMREAGVYAAKSSTLNPGGTGPKENSLINSVFEQYPTWSPIDPSAVAFSNTTVTVIDDLTQNDTMTGTGSSDVLLGGAGRDTLSGGSGNDYLMGGVRADTLTGGAGRDRFVYIKTDEAGDTITDFTPSEDYIDLGPLAHHYDWPNVNLFTAGYIRATQSSSNTLFQVDVDGGGNNYVTLAILKNVNAGSVTGNQLMFSVSPVLPSVGGMASYSVASAVPVAGVVSGWAAGVSPVSVATTQRAAPAGQFLRGKNDNDFLYGDVGNDQLLGSIGNDTIEGGAGNDKLEGGAGNDRMVGGAGDDYFLGGNGDDILYFGEGKDRASGGEGKDLFGYDAYDTMVDTISDFEPSEDELLFKSSVFAVASAPATVLTTEGTKKLFTVKKQSGGTAVLTYDSATGKLYWNASPAEPTTSVLIAQTSINLSLTLNNVKFVNTLP